MYGGALGTEGQELVQGNPAGHVQTVAAQHPAAEGLHPAGQDGHVQIDLLPAQGVERQVSAGIQGLDLDPHPFTDLVGNGEFRGVPRRRLLPLLPIDRRQPAQA